MISNNNPTDASLCVKFATHSGIRTHTNLNFVLSLKEGLLSVRPGYIREDKLTKIRRLVPHKLPPPATFFAAVYVHSELRFETNPSKADAAFSLTTWLEDEQTVPSSGSLACCAWLAVI